MAGSYARKCGETGVHVDMYRINASHSPFLSQPEKLAEVIRQATGEEI
jgi:hypothetical protein